MMRANLGILLVIYFVLSLDDVLLANPSLEIKLRLKNVETENLKPPLNGNHFELEIVNTRDQHTWIVWPLSGDETLPKSGLVPTAKPWSQGYFTLSKFNGADHDGEGHLTVLELIGNASGGEGHSLQAILVPPGGIVEFEDFYVSSWGKLNSQSIRLGGTSLRH